MKDRLEQLKAVRDPWRGKGTGDTLGGLLGKRVTQGWGSPRPHPVVGRWGHLGERGCQKPSLWWMGPSWGGCH